MKPSQRRTHYLFDNSRDLPIILDASQFSLEVWPPEILAERTAHPTGAFTTFRTLPASIDTTGVAVLAFEQHLARVRRDASALGLLDDSSESLHRPEVLTRLLLQTLRTEYLALGERATELRVRIVIRAPGVVEITTEPLSSSWDGLQSIRAKTVELSRPSPEIKSTDISICQSARRIAEAAEAEEALLLHANLVTEGAWSSFFYVDAKGALCTPARFVLPGITRQLILDSHAVTLVNTSREALLTNAREAFFCNATSGIVPVSAIDGVPIGIGLSRSVLDPICEWYRDLCGKAPLLLL